MEIEKTLFWTMSICGEDKPNSQVVGDSASSPNRVNPATNEPVVQCNVAIVKV